MTEIRLKRAYEAAAPSDGFRVYIDRLWPRGLSHATFRYDLWDKEIAPSTDLREWFHASPAERWQEFVRRYTSELHNGTALHALQEIIADKPVVTLLYSSRDHTHNNAAVVRDMLTK